MGDIAAPAADTADDWFDLNPAPSCEFDMSALARALGEIVRRRADADGAFDVTSADLARIHAARLQGRLLRANAAFCAWFGVDAKTLMARWDRMNAVALRRPTTLEDAQVMLTRGKVFQWTAEWKVADGTLRAARALCRVAPGHERRMDRVMCTLVDVTPQMRDARLLFEDDPTPAWQFDLSAVARPIHRAVRAGVRGEVLRQVVEDAHELARDVKMNAAAEALFAAQGASAEQRRALAFTPEVVRASVEATMAAVETGMAFGPFAAPVTAADGRVRHMLVRPRALGPPDDPWRRTVAPLIDITAIREAELAAQAEASAEARRSQTLFEQSIVPQLETDLSWMRHLARIAAAEGVAPGAWAAQHHARLNLMVSRHGGVRAANAAALKLIRSTREQMLADAWSFSSPEMVRFCIAWMDANGVDDLPPDGISGEVELLTLDGERLTVIASSIPLPGHETDWERCSTSLVDITDAVLARRALERAREAEQDARGRWEIAAEAAQAAVYEYDLANRRYLPSPRYEALIGQGLETINAVHGGSMRHLIPEPWRTHVAQTMADKLQVGSSFVLEYPVDRPDGRRIWVRSHIRVEPDDQGGPGRVFSFNIDITATKEQEMALVAAKQEAEQANRAKSEFLAAMSHEIRTPMNAVIGMAELLARLDLPPIAQDHVATLRESGQLLLSILNDLLDLSKIEAGKMDVERVPMSIDALLYQVHKLWAPRIEEKGLSFDIAATQRVPKQIIGDPSRLQQILFNLVSNALKFTQSGTITVKADARERDDGRCRLLIEVADTGLGMDDETLARLFRPFTQADASTNRRFGGTGLGLSISRRLAQAMGGDITVTSAPGKGSTFCVTLDVDSAEVSGLAVSEETPTAAPASRTRPLTILIAEDHPVNQRIILAFLAPLGHELVMVGNGQEAVAAARLRGYDLILMDVQMPVLDGLEATRAIRSTAGPNVATPIIGVTADAFEAQRRKGFEVGMNDYLTKPIDPRALEAAIARATAGRRAA